MSVAVVGQPERDARVALTQGITILERLGIIDFNGHMSLRLEDGSILINTGSSVRSAITPGDFVVTSAAGEYDPRAAAPPKELALHLAVYAARPDVGCVVHGHPEWSTLLTTAGVDYRVTLAQGALLGDIPVYPSPRSVNNPATAAEVAQVLGAGRAALLRAHGSVIAASDVLETTVLAIYLELNAERQVNASRLGDPYVFSDAEIAACRKGLAQRGLLQKCWDYYFAKFGLTDPH